MEWLQWWSSLCPGPEEQPHGVEGRGGLPQREAEGGGGWAQGLDLGSHLCEDFPRLRSREKTSLSDLPTATYCSCKPWGPAEEETKAQDLGF